MSCVCVHSLITRLKLKKMSVMYESAHEAITFQLQEISSITTLNQKQFQIFAQGTFFKGYLGKISASLRSCIMKKINLEFTCKRNRFGYWNLCKGLPNFVNVTVLLLRLKPAAPRSGVKLSTTEPLCSRNLHVYETIMF